MRLRAEENNSDCFLAETGTCFRALVEQSKDIVCATDADGRLLYISPSVRQYGYDPDVLISQEILSLIAESDREGIASKFAQAVETAADIHCEFKFLTKGKSAVWMSALGTARRNDDGVPCGMIMTLRDISEHKGVESMLHHRAMIKSIQADLLKGCLQLSGSDMHHALQEALRKFGEIFGADRAYIFRYDEDQNTISNTHEWCAAGVEPQNAHLQQLSVDAYPWWMSRLRRFEFLSIPSVGDLPAEAKAEKETLQEQDILSLAVAPIRWKDDLLGFMGLDFVREKRACSDEEIRDISMIANTLGLLLAQTSFEQSLSDQEYLYHTLVEDMPGLICRFKPDGTLTFVNDEYCRYFGKTRENLIGHSFMPLIPDEEQAMVRDSFGLCSATEPTVEYQHRVILPNGNTRWFRWIDRALFDENNTVTEHQSIGIDITETRNLEAQLAQSQKLETIGLLAGGIAHDFNNGLQSIQGFTEMAMDQIADEGGARQDLVEVLTAVKRAQRLTRQLLAFSRRQPLTPEYVNLAALIQAQQKMLSRILGEDIRIVLDLGEEIQPIWADPGQMEQVVLNLVVNAREAIPDGGQICLKTENVTVCGKTATSHPDARPGRYVCLSVTDFGCGIPPDLVEKIFDPFFTTKAKEQGTGLGLSMVHGIVCQHGGWTQVRSQVGRGTTFKIFLPVAQEEIDVHALSSPASAVVNTANPNGNVLVVEDEDHLAKIAARLLKSAGYRVTLATSVAEARKIFDAASCDFDVLLADVVLGDGNGVDLALALQEKHPDLRVLFVSGYPDERSRWRIIEENGWAYLMKPYSRDDLLRAMEELLQPA